jgi:hypothetical protein
MIFTVNNHLISKKKIIITDNKVLLDILLELKQLFSLEIFDLKNFLDKIHLIEKLDRLFVIVDKKKFDFIDRAELDFVIHLKNLPINISKLMRLINANILKKNYNNSSNIKIRNYYINFNSKIIKRDNIELKLTQKELELIIYLSTKNSPQKAKTLQRDIWKQKSDLETHTVETHIYRLRKKIKDRFNDLNFILNDKRGYFI